MNGELEIIVELARENVSKGDSLINAIANADKQLRFAIDEALNYEYKDVSIEKASNRRIKFEEEMFKKYRGIAHRVAKRYEHDLAFHQDIINEGYLALYECIRDFDYSLGIPFRNYAGKIIWMKQFKLLCRLRDSKRVKTRIESDDNTRKYKETVEFIKKLSIENSIKDAGEEEKGHKNVALGEMLSVMETGYTDIEANDNVESIFKFAYTIKYRKRYRNIIEILYLKIDGLSNKKIAEMMNCSSAHISKTLKLFGQEYKKSLEVSI